MTIAEPLRGGAFFGMGSPEVRGTVELEEGRRYELTVDYPVSPEDERVRGLAVGARAVPGRRPHRTGRGRRRGGRRRRS